MNCPRCQSMDTYTRECKTKLGYACYECCACDKRFNERTGTSYNYLTYPTDIVALVIFHYLRYRLSYENVAEIFWLRGFKLCAETIRLCVLRFGTLLGKGLRTARHGKAGKSWHVDETYLKVESEWCYCYRARDKQGELIDCFLSPTRDKASAVRFFKQALSVVGHEPDRITTDKNPAYPCAIEEVFTKDVTHRTNKYLNNLEEQDHRDIKSRYYSMKGFKDFMSAFIFCTLFEEVRNLFRHARNKSGDKKLNSTEKSRIVTSAFQDMQQLFAIA
jgi:putative transposase